MDVKMIDQLFLDTAYVRMGGSAEELRCAEYLQSKCAELGLTAHLEAFEVDMATMKHASLIADGEEIPCKGYLLAGSGEVEAPLYYLPGTDPASLAGCRDKIVMIDGYMGYWKYQDLIEHGAVGFITYDGNANYVDEDIDQRELRPFVSQGNKIPGVNINAKTAIRLIRDDIKTVKITLEQDEYKGQSHNVVMDLPGEIDEWIVCTAHYDSTSLSQGAYDNMSGSVGLLGIAAKFAKEPHRRSLRFIWCGSEERSLLGSKAYTAAHEDELSKIVFCLNLDMIGSIMGRFIACCTSEEKLVHYLQYLGSIQGFGIDPKDGVYASDSTPFADKGVPSLSFARIAPNNTATIHNSYDTMAILKATQMQRDIDFINVFAETMVNAVCFPVKKEIPQKMKDKLDVYLNRKREEG